MIKKITFDTEEELSEQIEQLSKQYEKEESGVIMGSGQGYTIKRPPKITIITISRTLWPHISTQNKYTKYEAWINIEGY